MFEDDNGPIAVRDLRSFPECGEEEGWKMA